MVVRLRLQRFGRTHSPFYRMVAADARAPRDGKFLEIVSKPMEMMIPSLPCFHSQLSNRIHSSFTISHHFVPPKIIRSARTIQSPTGRALKKFVSRLIDYATGYRWEHNLPIVWLGYWGNLVFYLLRLNDLVCRK